MYSVKYFAWLSTKGEKEMLKNGAVWAGLINDCPDKFKYLLDKSAINCYIEITKSI